MAKPQQHASHEVQGKETLCTAIDDFIEERIHMAIKGIVHYALDKIEENDVILTYGYNDVIMNLCTTAQVKFTVVIIDSRPTFSGRKLLSKLTTAGISCTYGGIHACAYMMKSVTKVFLGASAFMSNGAARAPIGTVGILSFYK